MGKRYDKQLTCSGITRLKESWNVTTPIRGSTIRMRSGLNNTSIKWADCIGETGKCALAGATGLGTQSFLVERIANHPGIRSVASSLLGSPIEFARRVRGVYAIFPKPPEEDWTLGPHGDYMAAQLSAMVLADDVPPTFRWFRGLAGFSHSTSQVLGLCPRKPRLGEERKVFCSSARSSVERYDSC